MPRVRLKQYRNICRHRGNARETEMGETFGRLSKRANLVKSQRWMALVLLVAANAFAARAAYAANPYADHSDQELTSIAADWEALSEDERRALLTEMRGRMAAKKDDGDGRVIAIRTQRRYGRLVRQPDGSLVRVETTEQVVQYRRVPEGEAGDRAFGVGFERRAGEAPAPAAEPADSAARAPVLVDHTPP
jgi:hypothetical protein